MQKQKGVVLFFALIVLLMMTVIGVALAVNSTQSIRMAGASSERVVAKSEAKGGQDRVIVNNSGRNFANVNTMNPVKDPSFNVTSSFIALSDGDVDCARKVHASQASVIDCVPIEVSSQSTYGRSNMGRLTLVAGIEQEVLANSGN
ncbi:pilus assembly PilX family protein [Shewanella sp. 30m-9]